MLPQGGGQTELCWRSRVGSRSDLSGENQQKVNDLSIVSVVPVVSRFCPGKKSCNSRGVPVVPVKKSNLCLFWEWRVGGWAGRAYLHAYFGGFSRVK